MRAGWIVCAVVALLLLLLAAALRQVYVYAFRRSKRRDRQIQRNAEKRYAKLLCTARKWLGEHPVQEVCVTSFDGLCLRGRWIPCKEARGSLLLFHGWRSAPEIDFGAALEFYHSLGLNLLLVSQRAHGASEGVYLTFGVRERRDVHTWVGWHNETVGAQIPVFLGGLSMGATTVLMSCGEAFPANVRGVIADCGFTSPYEIVCAVAKRAHLPAKPIVPLLNALTKRFAGFALEEYSTLHALEHSQLPVFLAHGEADTFVPCEMSRRAFAACAAADKTLLLAPEAKHGESYLKQKDAYCAAVSAFVDRNLPNTKEN